MASPLDRFQAPSPSTDIALGWLDKLTSGDGRYDGQILAAAGTFVSALDSKVHESMVSASTRAAYLAVLGQLEAERRAAMSPTLTASDLAAAGDADSYLMRLLNPLWTPVIQGWLQPDSTGKTPQSDPIADLVSLGHATLGGAQAALVGGATLGVAACNIAGTAAGLCGAYEFAKPPRRKGIPRREAVGDALSENFENRWRRV